MTAYAHTSYPRVHPGVQRFSKVAISAKNLVAQFDVTRNIALILLSAIVSTVLVVVNQVIDTYTDGHMLAAWMFLWVVAFSTIALLATPIRESVVSFGPAFLQWKMRRAERANDHKMWEVALQDPRVMAEIQRAISQQ
jgi:hypothetical protein